MILNDTRTVRFVIAGYYDGLAGLTPDGEIAFHPGDAGIRTGDWPATVDGAVVRVKLDKSRWKKDHPFLYSKIAVA